jgi:hypothetical protein
VSGGYMYVGFAIGSASPALGSSGSLSNKVHVLSGSVVRKERRSTLCNAVAFRSEPMFGRGASPWTPSWCTGYIRKL